METSAIKTEKEQRIQELFEMSIEKCGRAAKQSVWITILGIVLIVLLLMTVSFAKVQSNVLKVCGSAGVVLLLLIQLWLSNQFNSQMSKAQDVNELLRVNDKQRKKLAIFTTILILLSLAVVYVVMGGLEHPNPISAVICIMICVVFYFRASRDCEEVRDIKELMREN